jgi:hypothetical protein
MAQAALMSPMWLNAWKLPIISPLLGVDLLGRQAHIVDRSHGPVDRRRGLIDLPAGAGEGGSRAMVWLAYARLARSRGQGGSRSAGRPSPWKNTASRAGRRGQGWQARSPRRRPV